MRLTWRDALATLFVAAAAALYALWQTGTAVVGMSTRVLGAVVFGLGWAGCMSDQGEMASVYGAGGRPRAPMVYVVVASLLGAVALVAGIMTLISASETMLAILVAATVVLWVLATVRHAATSQGRPSDRPVRGRRGTPQGPAAVASLPRVQHQPAPGSSAGRQVEAAVGAHLDGDSR